MIKLENIYKSFGNRILFENLNVHFEANKTTAILGPNASGKTTLIKIILGLVRQNKGRVFVNGKDTLKDPSYRRFIGYMPQIPEFPENLTIKEIVNMVKNLRNENLKNFDELVEILNLSNELNKKFVNLSGGTKQKVGALLAFCFDLPILILDEPFIGLDIISAYNLRSLIMKEKEKGKTIIYISHIISDLEEIADNVIFLNYGNILFNGSLIELKRKTGKDKLAEAMLCLLNS
ncbi:MAG: ABC transporter ATP-binding protein [candidate division WOR-3 bacterium]|jgi:Cu-processing system ATP-binding protein